MAAQMRDVFQENRFVTQRDMIKQDQVLMDLPHIANMRHHRNTVFPRQQADCNELADATEPHTIGLQESRRVRLQIILENHLIGHMLADRPAAKARWHGSAIDGRVHHRGWVGSSIQKGFMSRTCSHMAIACDSVHC